MRRISLPTAFVSKLSVCVGSFHRLLDVSSDKDFRAVGDAAADVAAVEAAAVDVDARCPATPRGAREKKKEAR